MKSPSSLYVKHDIKYNFYYLDLKTDDLRFVYLRTTDISRLLSIPKDDISDKNYMDLWSVCLFISAKSSNLDELKFDQFRLLNLYLHDTFSDSSKFGLIVPSDLAETDSSWSNLI